MRFVKFKHLDLHGHTHTQHNGKLMMQRLVQKHLRYGHDDDEPKETWRDGLRDVEHAFDNGTPEECLEDLTTLYDDESLPEDIAKELEPLLKELQTPRPRMLASVFVQTDMDCDVQRVEDGHDRVPPDPGCPMCTIVWRNGHWVHVFGTAEETVKELKGGRA